MDKIYIRGLRVYAYHGVEETEKEKGQPFELDITLEADLRRPGATDDLNDTVNYSKVTKRVLAVMQAEKNDLIERAAQRVAEAVLADFPVEAVTVLLEHYGVACAGKRAVVIGRSPVVGRPAAMLLLARNATVTVCHTATADLPAVTREADIIVSAAGAAGSLTVSHVRPGQTVIDVSVSWDAARNAMVGDAEFDAVSAVVDAITPVPGGVGAVTSAVLMRHVVLAAERGRK